MTVVYVSDGFRIKDTLYVSQTWCVRKVPVYYSGVRFIRERCVLESCPY